MNTINQQALGANLLRITLGIMFLAHSVVLKYFTFTLAGTAQYFEISTSVINRFGVCEIL